MGEDVGESYIHAVNIALAAAIVCGLSAIYFYDRTRNSALWWMLSFVSVLIMGIAAALLPLIAPAPVTQYIVFAFNIMAISCLNVGIAWHRGCDVPWRLIDTFLATALVINFFTLMLLPSGPVQMTVSALSLAATQSVGLYILLHRNRDDKDPIFAFLLGLTVLNYFSRPLLEMVNQGAAVSGEMTASMVLVHVNNALTTIGLASFLMFRLAARLLIDLKGQSETDSLSGLLNRHGFQMAIQRFQKGGENRAPASLIICDLDRFKSINDEYGHYVGDRVIAAFGRLVRAGAREGDVCGRIGGEEFCVFLRNSDGRAARLFAEWLRVAFASTSYGDLDGSVRFTASFGVAQIGQSEDIEETFKRADKALYTAKRDGRNCVRSVDEDGVSSSLSGIRFGARTGS